MKKYLKRILRGNVYLSESEIINLVQAINFYKRENIIPAFHEVEDVDDSLSCELADILFQLDMLEDKLLNVLYKSIEEELPL